MSRSHESITLFQSCTIGWHSSASCLLCNTSALAAIFKYLVTNVNNTETMHRVHESLTLAHKSHVFCVLSITLQPLVGFSNYFAQTVRHIGIMCTAHVMTAEVTKQHFVPNIWRKVSIFASKWLSSLIFIFENKQVKQTWNFHNLMLVYLYRLSLFNAFQVEKLRTMDSDSNFYGHMLYIK